MDREAIFAVVRGNLLELMPQLDPASVTLDRSLAELGCNSVDRADVYAMSMEDLSIAVPVMEFGQVSDLRSLVQVLQKHL